MATTSKTDILPDLFEGPPEIRRRMVEEFGEDWTVSYLDRAVWNPTLRTVTPLGYIAFERMAAAAGHIAREMNFRVAKEPPRTVTRDPSIADKMRSYKEAADKLRLEAIQELVRTTGTRNVTLMNERAKELWERAEKGDAMVAEMASSIASAAQRRSDGRPNGDRGRHEREADMMTLEEVMSVARKIAEKRGACA